MRGKEGSAFRITAKVARELIPPPLQGAILWRSREVGRGMPGREIPPWRDQ